MSTKIRRNELENWIENFFEKKNAETAKTDKLRSPAQRDMDFGSFKVKKGPPNRIRLKKKRHEK